MSLWYQSTTAPPRARTFILHVLACNTGWRRLIGSPKLQIIFHKRATKYRSLLRKMTYKDKGSYESSPPCTKAPQPPHEPAHQTCDICLFCGKWPIKIGHPVGLHHSVLMNKRPPIPPIRHVNELVIVHVWVRDTKGTKPPEPAHQTYECASDIWMSYGSSPPCTNGQTPTNTAHQTCEWIMPHVWKNVTNGWQPPHKTSHQIARRFVPPRKQFGSIGRRQRSLGDISEGWQPPLVDEIWEHMYVNVYMYTYIHMNFL